MQGSTAQSRRILSRHGEEDHRNSAPKEKHIKHPLFLADPIVCRRIKPLRRRAVLALLAPAETQHWRRSTSALPGRNTAVASEAPSRIARLEGYPVARDRRHQGRHHKHPGHD